MRIKCWIRIVLPEYRPHSVFCVSKHSCGWGDKLITEATPHLFDSEEEALKVIEEIKPTYTCNETYLTVVTRILL